MIKPDYPFDLWLKRKLKDPRFKRAYRRYELPARLAAQVSTLRKKRGMTQAEMARRIHSAQEVISRLENAARPNVTIQTLEKIAKALGKHLDIRFL